MSDELEDYAADDDLRSALRRALRTIDGLKRDREDYADVLYQAAHDSLTTLAIPPVPKPKADRRRKDPETAVVALSDWQLGKVTPTYNSEICAQRISKLADKVELLTAIQRKDHPVDECVVFLVGDLVEGENIFPGQAHHIDASLYQQVMVDGPAILSGFIRRMASIFPKVRVVGVVGNHGRLGRKHDGVSPESNADAILYEVARLITQDERVAWTQTWEKGEKAWYAIETIRGHNFLTFHGDQIRGGFAGFPFYGASKRLWGWSVLAQQLGLMDPFRYAIWGHWHQPVRLYLNGITGWCSPSTEDTNTYAIESLSSAGEPGQWLLFVHEDGVGAEYLVRL